MHSTVSELQLIFANNVGLVTGMACLLWPTRVFFLAV